MEKQIAIIGAGPAGLGAGYRLHELGYRDWVCLEQNDYPGGLAASFEDQQGFWWDVGGHVLFSHYAYFDDVFESVMKSEYFSHQRSSWIRIADTFVPYPFQNNIRYLPPELLYDCLLGIIEATYQDSRQSARTNFLQWCRATFGSGITRHFMAPYNRKVWAQPLDSLSADWIAERVSVVDLQRILSNVIFEKDDISWGPNNTFKFPRHGATGEIFRRIAKKFSGNIKYKKKVTGIHLPSHTLVLADGSKEHYDELITTMPLTELLEIIDPLEPALVKATQDALVATSAIIVGVGFKGTPPEGERCWMYFPESNCPFYRTTYFHHYSPYNVPGENYFSFMCETSYSSCRPINTTSIIDDTIQGLCNAGLISEEQKDTIVSTYVIDVPYSYPVPSLGRNAVLSRLIPYLEKNHIHSRGRFGLWLYEIGNMDHSFMQGVECVNRMLDNEREEVIAPFKKFLTSTLHKSEEV